MDGPPPQEEDFSSLSIQDRLAHKNWKARVSAYEELIKSFSMSASETDPVFKPFVNNPDTLKKIVTDANAVAQEKGVECVVALVKFAGENAVKTRDTVVPALVEKCFGSARAGTKNQATELSLQYVEVENGGTGVVTDILPGLGAKQPKAVAGCVVALKEVIRCFGAQVTPPQPLLKAIPKIFAHTDKTVRAEGVNLAHVLYQAIGPAIEPFLADLKPVQVKELKEAFEKMDTEGNGKGTLKPERMTRAQAREAENAQDDGQPGEGAGDQPEEPVEMDPRAFVEPVDIIPKLPASFHTNLKSSKWKERKEALDELLTLLKATPRIQDNPELSELAKSLATCVSKDANIACVMVAASCQEELAKGMMTSFGRLHEAVVPPMLERMKERKATVTDAIGQALDAVFDTTTLADILPDFDNALKSKNPQVKEGTLKLLGRCLSRSTTPIPPGQVKPLSETLAALLEDSFEGCRNEAATCLGTLMKMVGERPLNALMDTLADVRKAKVKEAFEKATIKCKGTSSKPKPESAKPAAPKAAPPAKAKPPAAKAAPAPPDEDALLDTIEPPKKPVTKRPVLSSSKKPPAPAASEAPAAPASSAPAVKKLPPSAAPSKPSKGAAPAAAGALDTFKYKHTPDDADALAADQLPSTIMTDFADSNWKTRLAALEELTTWVESNIETLDAEVLVRALAKKGWTEKNFQVSTKLYGILTALAERCPSFGRSCCALSTGHLTEKLGDMKLKKPAGDALLAFAEKTSLQFVLNQAYEPLGKQKAPKVLADAIMWVNTGLVEFGIAGLSLRGLIDFLKMGLQNSNAAVRTSATKTLVTVKLFAGSSILSLLEDLNPQLLSTITSEFEKADGTPAPEPTRQSVDLQNMAPVDSGKGASGGGDPMDDLFPRVEIDSLLKGTTILADSKNDAWKVKKEALETLQAILDQGSNKRLKGSMGEIGQVLKARLTDTNKAVQSLALDIVCRIATGMGKPFEKHTRLYVLPICTVLSDQKAPTRAAATQALTAMAAACEGVESMTSGIGTALESPNPLQKGTLLHWLSDWFKEHPPRASLDLSGWVSATLACLDDRSGEVRKGAQALLPTLIQCAGYDYVIQQTNGLKPASRASAVPLIQNARPAAPASEKAPPAEPTKPTKPSKPPAITTSTTPSASAPSSEPQSPAATSQPPAKSLGVRRKLPLGSRPESRAETPTDSTSVRPKASMGLKRPGAVESVQSSSSSSHPFQGINFEARKARCSGKDMQRWAFDAAPARKDMIDLLCSQMESHVSKELFARLFSRDHNAVNDFITGMSTMADFYTMTTQDVEENMTNICLANFDLPLKYACIRVHEPQPNLVTKCLDVIEAVLSFLRTTDYQLTDGEALCFIPTIINKLGDAREPVRVRVSQIIRSLPKVYAYSRLFQLLLETGKVAKAAKTRQGALDEIGAILKKSGMGACDPSKAFPVVAGMISDKDALVRKSALGVLSEAYPLVGETIWTHVGKLDPKEKTQLEERLRRVPGPSGDGRQEAPAPAIPRLAGAAARADSPTLSRLGGVPRAASPAVAGASRLARPSSPAQNLRTGSPTRNNLPRADSPTRQGEGAADDGTSALPKRPKSLLPSKLGLGPSKLRARQNLVKPPTIEPALEPPVYSPKAREEFDDPEAPPTPATDDISLTISSILSNDPSRSVDALKKIQKILSVGPDASQESSRQYSDLAEHTEGLIETICLQMAHVLEHVDELIQDENFRLAKHLIQTLNNFCDHTLLAESLTVDILTSLLEELTLRLLKTDESPQKKIKDLSRFINMIILRLFATGRRMSVFRALFALLLQIVKPFPSKGTLPDAEDARVAELVLKCIWKLARNIPQDLSDNKLDAVELFPAIEHFLQSVPPNEWRARATNKIPCGDMPLRTIKVIIQHVVAHYGDEVYDHLSESFDDPSATIVYPYVYRILNASSRAGEAAGSHTNGDGTPSTRPVSVTSSRPSSPQGTISSAASRRDSPINPQSPSASTFNGHGGSPTPAQEADTNAQLSGIMGRMTDISTGHLHKEGINELHLFLKNNPHLQDKVDEKLSTLGKAFHKYVKRALATRAAEDQDRNAAVAHTLNRLESKSQSAALSDHTRRASISNDPAQQDKLSRLHDIFQYRSSTGSSEGK